MTIKIYGMPFSTCAARVLATLAEKEVKDYEVVPVDLSAGEHKKPEFLKMQSLAPLQGTFPTSSNLREHHCSERQPRTRRW